MQPSTFGRNFRELLSAIKASSLLEFLSQLLRPQSYGLTQQHKDSFSHLIFESRDGYIREVATNEKKLIADSFSLSKFFDPTVITAMVSKFNIAEGSAQIANDPLFRDFYYLLAVASSFVDSFEKTVLGSLESNLQLGEDSLEIEFPADTTSVENLANALRSLQTLNELYSIVLGTELRPFQIQRLESGSPIKIILKGGEKVVAEIRTLLKEIWHNIYFKKETTFEKRVSSFSEGLALIDLLENSVNRGSLTREAAENAKQQILSSGLDLFKSGAITTQILQSEVRIISHNERLEQLAQVPLLDPPKEDP